VVIVIATNVMCRIRHHSIEWAENPKEEIQRESYGSPSASSGNRTAEALRNTVTTCSGGISAPGSAGTPSS
jgi:hypothetical protein